MICSLHNRYEPTCCGNHDGPDDITQLMWFITLHPTASLKYPFVKKNNEANGIPSYLYGDDEDLFNNIADK